MDEYKNWHFHCSLAFFSLCNSGKRNDRSPPLSPHQKGKSHGDDINYGAFVSQNKNAGEPVHFSAVRPFQ